MAVAPQDWELASMRRLAPRTNSTRSMKPSVEKVEARILLATFVVTDTNDDTNMGSLRFAITQSDATPGSNAITFDIAASGVQTIDVLSALPAITVPVTIDGTTEPGYAGTPLVELDGAGAGAKVDGLDISAGSTTVSGLAINRFSGEGISLSVVGVDAITKDFLGTDPTGTIAEGNTLDGLFIQANSNSNTVSGDVISGNTGNGIHLDGSTLGSTTTFTTGDLIAGNRIGTDVTGTLALGNNHDGIYDQNAPMLTVGGTTTAARNIISGNGTGMELYDNSDGSVFEGNYIGTDITGEVALGNNLSGGFFEDNVVLRGLSNGTIGGTAAGAGNVISGGSHYGIDSFVIGSDNIAIQGNLIGTDATGLKPLGNASGGVVISGPTGVTIGGTAAGARNVISDNGGNGIYSTSPGILIQGNLIGTDVSGAKALGNTGSGIVANGPTGVTIGGTVAAARNVISSNESYGILSQGSTTDLIEGNRIGTDITGTLPLGNTGDGIIVLGDTDVTIGGTVAAALNVISANKQSGIFSQGSSIVLIEGNEIGTDLTGTLDLGNGGDGVRVLVGSVSIGGLAAGQGNTIAYNGTSPTGFGNSGVEIVDSTTPGIPILSNSIFQDENLGIDLNNSVQGTFFSPPTLTSATTNGMGSVISGTVTAAPGLTFSGTYTLQFFSTPTLNASGNAEGRPCSAP